MNIQGALTPDDYFQAMRMRMRGSLLGQLTFGVMVFGIPFFTAHKINCWVFGPFFGIYLILILAFVQIAVLGIRPRSIERQFAKDKTMQGPRDIQITPERLVISAPGVSLDTEWKRYATKYQIGEDIILLVHTAKDYQVLPKRWFTPEQLVEFQGYLQAALGKPRGAWF